MNYNTPSLLLIVQLIGWTSLSVGIQPIKPATAIETQYIAQSAAPDSLEESDAYDTLMQKGYSASNQKDYEAALASFQQALAERPGDPFAQQAIQNMESYISRGVNPSSVSSVSVSTASESGGFNWLIPLLVVGGIGAGGVGFFLLRRSSTEPTFDKEEKNPFSTDTPVEPYVTDSSADPYVANSSVDDRPFPFRSNNEADERDIWDTSLPVQATTRIPSPEFIDEMVRELQNPQPKKRRRAIWKLAQSADSRAMKPLLDLMIDADSYERNLILEALSQISSRTIKPMNQALALSLQDKNPQVRKNAIRDLTRLYDMMSQVSQLLCHSIDDTDEEVQETAKWALNQLNLQMPPRLDLLINKDNETMNPEVMNNHYEETPATEK